MAVDVYSYGMLVAELFTLNEGRLTPDYIFNLDEVERLLYYNANMYMLYIFRYPQTYE
jgi:hypothetical protein